MSNRTRHADTPAIGELYDPLIVKGVLVDAMRTGEERDADRASGIHGNSGEQKGVNLHSLLLRSVVL